MSFFFRRDKRVVELRGHTTDAHHWSDYFVAESDAFARPAIMKRLADAEIGVMPQPYQRILASNDLRGKKIVDMGCGIGLYVLALQRQGLDVEGVEYSSELVERLSRRYPELNIHCEDALQTHYKDSSVDIALSLGVVEHRERGPDVFLREMYRVLRSDGLLLISVPFYNLFWRIRMALSDPYNPSGMDRLAGHFYQYRFSSREFRNLMTNEGFQIVKYGNAGAMKPFEDAFPAAKKLFALKGGYRLRNMIIKPMLEALPHSGHMFWVVARKL
jgi:SAM-dependent methyltransferase